MKATSERKNMYDVINDMIINKLQNGKTPWKQTWNDFGPARNFVNKKPYRGINALLLNNLDFEYPLYLTFLQAKELGGHIKKGSKSIEVIYWNESGRDFKQFVNIVLCIEFCFVEPKRKQALLRSNLPGINPVTDEVISFLRFGFCQTFFREKLLLKS